MNSNEIIRLESVDKTLIWGTEQWGISGHSAGDCKVLNPEYKGYTLSRLWKEHQELFDNAASSHNLDRFPLLTKIIDAKNDLSIQVHPDNEYAGLHENGSLGKTECWYIMDAEPGTKIVIGHNARNKAEVEKMIQDGDWSSFIRQVDVHKGDFFFIKPGTVHAIKGGTVILETQQSSDITYRVYDYDRLQDGKKRPLHVKQSIDVIVSPFREESPSLIKDKTVNGNIRQLAGCEYFTVWYGKVEGELSLEQDQSFMLCSVISGSCSLNETAFSKGEHFIVPHGFGSMNFTGNAELILSTI